MRLGYPGAVEPKQSGGAGAALDPSEFHAPASGTAIGAQHRAPRAAQPAQDEGVAGSAVAEHWPQQQEPVASYVSARSWD
jgi:hypothetical protein